MFWRGVLPKSCSTDKAGGKEPVLRPWLTTQPQPLRLEIRVGRCRGRVWSVDGVWFTQIFTMQKMCQAFRETFWNN